MPPPILRTARLVLRPFTPDDAPTVERLAGNRNVARTTLNIPHPYPEGAAATWIAEQEAAFERGENVLFAITAEADALVGAISLHIETRHLRGEIGYWIGEPYWNRGYATEALAVVLDHGFGTLGLHRIQARYLPGNPASGRVMEKAGMLREGLLRGYVRKDGEFLDLMSYAILRADWVASDGPAPQAP